MSHGLTRLGGSHINLFGQPPQTPGNVAAIDLKPGQMLLCVSRPARPSLERSSLEHSDMGLLAIDLMRYMLQIRGWVLTLWRTMLAGRYESAKCMHGRPKVFYGKYYSSVFVHYRPAVSSQLAYNLTHKLKRILEFKNSSICFLRA